MAANRSIVAVEPIQPEQVDEFGATIPLPQEAFKNYVVHPRNIALEERRESARPLSAKELKQIGKELKAIFNHLRDVGWFTMSEEYAQLQHRYRFYKEQRDSAKTQEENLEAVTALSEIIIQARQIKPPLNSMKKQGKRYYELLEMLNDHQLAMERQRLHDSLSKELSKEAHHFQDLIIETYSRLGFKHEYTHKNRKYIHRVAFDRIVVTPDTIHYKLFVSTKTFFGFKNVMPNGVKVQDLIDPYVLKELSIACQRQVTSQQNYTSGVWIRVNRIGTVDGLLGYVTLEQVLNNYPREDRDFLPIGFGVGEGRMISWVHLAKHPHFLIGGSTGGGKSNAINVIICTLIQKHTPEEVQFCLIDLKEGLEFQHFENIPHLVMPVVKDIEQAANVLNQLEVLRAQRAQLLAGATVKDIDQYNALADLKGFKRMPRIVVIFDEYAAIQIRRDMEASIQASVMQLLNKGRAAGVHMILCTQNPSVDIIPGPSKANMAFRLAGLMPTKSASMTILGVGDAADLPDIKGRMIAMVGAKRWFIQTPHVRTIDLEKSIIKALEYQTVESETPIVELPESKGYIGFTEDDLLALCINNFNGNLGARPIFDGIKDTGVNVTLAQMNEMVKKITDRGEPIEYGGKIYMPRRSGKGYRLIEQQPLEEAEVSA